MRKLKIGLLGCGVVGGGFVRLLEENASLIRSRAEAELSISKVLVRDARRERPFVPPGKITTCGEDVVRNGADIIVELIGGTSVARSLVREALGSSKHVVTANKRLLALCGGELFDLASIHRVRLGFEASVCGAIPVIRVVRDALAGDRIESIEGIVNGTSNYILSRMEETDATFEDALAEAQAKGFAEADPTLDVDGSDAAEKITILARLAFPTAEIRWKSRAGIRGITRDAIESAAREGNVVRHVASVSWNHGAVD
ncbi:MAG TPA: homoserine dehydrogenase, partial [Thermoanaerobaculia bacterium]|nr:homoserine dehydrogenase [Thermoanaerobaculia bacterium]